MDSHVGLCLCFLGRTLLQILTVPPEKGANNNKSSTGTVHHLILFLTILIYFILYLINLSVCSLYTDVC